MATSVIYLYKPKDTPPTTYRRRHRELLAMVQRQRAAEARMKTSDEETRAKLSPPNGKRPSANQLAWLKHGLDQAGGKLPLFDGEGRRINAQTIRSCMERGWAEPWFSNPVKPDWLVCKLTDLGRNVVQEMEDQGPESD